MNDKLLNFLNKAKLSLGIVGVLVGVVIVFANMRTDISANEHHVNVNRSTIETLQIENKAEHKEMIEILNTNNTNIKLLQKDVEYIAENVDKIGKRMSGEEY